MDCFWLRQAFSSTLAKELIRKSTRFVPISILIVNRHFEFALEYCLRRFNSITRDSLVDFFLESIAKLTMYAHRASDDLARQFRMFVFRVYNWWFHNVHYTHSS
jgi:hypothetical protein